MSERGQDWSIIERASRYSFYYFPLINMTQGQLSMLGLQNVVDYRLEAISVTSNLHGKQSRFHPTITVGGVMFHHQPPQTHGEWTHIPTSTFAIRTFAVIVKHWRRFVLRMKLWIVPQGGKALLKIC